MHFTCNLQHTLKRTFLKLLTCLSERKLNLDPINCCYIPSIPENHWFVCWHKTSSISFLQQVRSYWQPLRNISAHSSSQATLFTAYCYYVETKDITKTESTFLTKMFKINLFTKGHFWLTEKLSRKNWICILSAFCDDRFFLNEKWYCQVLKLASHRMQQRNVHTLQKHWNILH